MSKLRRNNMVESRKRNKANDFKDISTNGRFNLNRNKFISTDEFFNRIQKSLYYGDRRSKLSIPLSDYIADSFSETHAGYSLNRLNYSTIGNLNSTPCTLILALCYLERLKEADPSYTKRVTPTELFLVSMMVATKFYSGHDDEAPSVDWTECASSESLLQMELSFLDAIDWKVYVSREQFFEKVKSLEMILARQQGSKHGFFTYLEMNSVMPSVDSVTQFIQTTIILGFSYTVFVATMVASVFLVSQIPGTCLHKPIRSTSMQANVEIPSENSTTPTLLNESREKKICDYDLNLILNEMSDEDQWKKPNATTWIPIFSSWYSRFFPVISDSLNKALDKEYTAWSGLNLTFPLYSPVLGRFKSNIQGLKMHWV